MSTNLTEMNAKITADTNNVLAGLERVKKSTQDLGRVAQQSSKTAASSFDTLVAKVDKVGNATAGALNAVYALEAQGSARVLALGNAFGSVAGLLGPGGKLVQGVAIVASSIAALFLQAKEKSAEATKAISEDLEKLVNAGDFATITKRLREIDQGTAGKDFQDGRTAIQQRIDALKLEASAVGKSSRFYRERQQKIIAEKETLTALNAEYDRYYRALTSPRNSPRTGGGPLAITVSAESTESLARSSKQLADRLEALRQRALQLNEALDKTAPSKKYAADINQLIDELEKAGVPVRTLQAELAALNEAAAGGGAAAARAQGRIAAIRAEYGRTLDIVDDLVRSQEQFAGEESAAKAQRLSGIVDGQNDRLERQNQLLVARLEARDDAADVSARAVADIEAEIVALRKGGEAYDDYLRKKVQEAAVLEVVKKARAEGRQATAQELIDARTTAAYLFDAAQVAAQLQKALGDSGAGEMALALAGAAEYATQIATSLGDAGVNIAKVAAIAGPLFKGLGALQQSLQKRDEKGNMVAGQTVSLFQSLSGKNGKESQSQSAFASVAIIGAVFQIADALDVFGREAEAKAAEMQQAAREFAKGLEDFLDAANPTTGASKAIRDARRNAEELTKAAFKAGGGTFNENVEITAEYLRKLAIATVAAGEGESKKTKQTVAQIAADLNEAADALERVEAAAREQVLRNIEDLNVRKLLAAGLTEEAALLERKLANERAIREAEGDRTDVGIRYLALLKDTLAAEEARAIAEERRAKALALLDDTLAIMGGTKVEQLSTVFGTLKQLFPQFATLFDGLDLSTAEGLNGAKANLRELFRTLSLDGITDAERPIVDAIKQLLGSIEGAFGELVDPLTAALEVFSVRVEVFGLNAQEQFALLADILSDAFPDVATLLQNAGGQSLEEIKAALQARIAALLEGGIEEGERPLLDALRQLLANIVGQLDDAAREAADAAAEAEAARQQRVSRSDRTLNGELALGGLDGNDALQARIRAFAGQSPLFAQLLPLFSDTSAAGIRNTKDALFQLFRDITAGKVDIAQFGDLTEDEIIAKIIELGGNLDGLADSLSDAAKAAEEAAAAERKQTTDLRIRLARSRGEETRLAEFDANAQAERDAAIAAGRSAGFLQFLDQVLSSERSKLLADIAGEATSAAVAAAADATKQAGAQNTEFVRNVGSLTEVTGQTVAGYLKSIDANTRTAANAALSMLQVLGALRATGSIPIPALPGFSGNTTTAGTVIINMAAPVVNAPAGVSATEYGTALGRAQVRAIDQALGRLNGVNVRFLGGASR